jgi:hypothetical protein
MRTPDNAARSLSILSLGTKETLYQTHTVVYGTGKHVTPVTMNSEHTYRSTYVDMVRKPRDLE